MCPGGGAGGAHVCQTQGLLTCTAPPLPLPYSSPTPPLPPTLHLLSKQNVSTRQPPLQVYSNAILYIYASIAPFSLKLQLKMVRKKYDSIMSYIESYFSQHFGIKTCVFIFP